MQLVLITAGCNIAINVKRSGVVIDLLFKHWDYFCLINLTKFD
jgi:hypothetical protein